MSCTCSKGEATICCDICKQKVFCSADCQTIGWSAHSDNCNVHVVDEPDHTIFTVDAGVEFMTPEEVSRLEGNEEFLQSDIVQYYDPKGIVHETLVEAKHKHRFEETEDTLGYGEKVKPAGYSIVIKVNDRVVTIDSKQIEAISKKNKLASISSKRWRGKAVFWCKELNIPIKNGTIEAVLNREGKEIANVAGPIQLTKKYGMTKQLKPEYNIKFGSSRRYKPESLVAYTGYSHDKSNAFRFIVHNKTTIVDVEFAFSNKKHSDRMGESISQPFKCDANDIDHVTGLVAALEDKMASGELDGDKIEQHFNIINAHREALEKNGGEALAQSPKVNAAIHSAVGMLWENVGRRYRDTITAKLDKFRPIGAVKWAEQETGKLKDKIIAARRKAAGKGPKSWFSRGNKIKLLRSLDEWELAINSYGRSHNNRTSFERADENIQKAREQLMDEE
jgi:hypothetical protein